MPKSCKIFSLRSALAQQKDLLPSEVADYLPVVSIGHDNRQFKYIYIFTYICRPRPKKLPRQNNNSIEISALVQYKLL